MSPQPQFGNASRPPRRSAPAVLSKGVARPPTSVAPVRSLPLPVEARTALNAGARSGTAVQACLGDSRLCPESAPNYLEEFFPKNSYTRKDAGFLALARAAVRSPSRLAMHKLSPACWSVTDLAPSRTGTRGSYGAT